MKKGILTFIFLLCNILLYAQKGYQIKLELTHFRTGEIYLGNYYGENTFLVDTAQIQEDGFAVFEQKEKLPAGIYFILFPNKKKYFEILMDGEQHFTIQVDTSQNFKNVTFKGSQANLLFQKYNQYIDRERQKVNAAQKAGEDSATLAAINQEVNKRIQNYRKEVIQKHPKSVLSSLFRVMQDPKIPENLKEDKKASYYYYRKHYWDRVDFSDSAMVRSPILESRLSRYFNQLVVQSPDSINHAADKILEKAEANKENFKFVLWWLTSTYERSQYMGMDAVFVHLVETYYVPGEAFWLNDEQLQKIIEKAAKIAPNLIGNKAPEITMRTANQKEVHLLDIQAQYTVLVFWDPTCSHCKIVVPRLDSVYQENQWEEKDIKVVGVLAGGTKTQWLDFIKKHHLEDWINLWDPQNKSPYRQLYDVYQTPIIYLLDENKKIIAKQLSVNQLADFIKADRKRKKS